MCDVWHIKYASLCVSLICYGSHLNKTLFKKMKQHEKKLTDNKDFLKPYFTYKGDPISWVSYYQTFKQCCKDVGCKFDWLQ